MCAPTGSTHRQAALASPWNLHTYLLFIGAVVVLCAVPGPDIAYLLARTIAQGRKAGFVAAIGINAGA